MLTATESIAELFCQLVAIPSPSGSELLVGQAIRAWLSQAGVNSDFDRAGAVNGSDSGNLIAIVPGAPGGPVLLLVAHMDTVEVGAPAIEPVLGGDGVIRSAGPTILGADNKSAVAATMLACAGAARLDPGRRPTVIAAFTCREEAGQMGASLLQLPPIDCAFSVDGSQPIGTVITRALGQSGFSIEIRGRAAHAAAGPENGVSAIAVAAEAVTAMTLGRLDGGGSASIASIVGGAVIDRLDGSGLESVRAALERTPTNSVPDLVLLRGEVRGYSVDQIATARTQLQTAVAAACDARGATYAWTDRERAIPPFPGAPSSRALELARVACARVGIDCVTTEAHATLEANYLAATTDVVALASGGRDPHQHSESITVGELEQLQALLTAIVAVSSPGA